MTTSPFYLDDGYLSIEKNGFKARMILDSVSEFGARLTTMELTFPRYILSEFNTHRLFSRNSASSRAIPVHKQIAKILNAPFVPQQHTVRYNESGMQGNTVVSDKDYQQVEKNITIGAYYAVLTSLSLTLGIAKTREVLGETVFANPYLLHHSVVVDKINEALKEYQRVTAEARRNGVEQEEYLDIHKQLANRPLEPYMWHTVIVSSTEWDNFWELRDDKNADPQIETIAKLAHQIFEESTPQKLQQGQWHLPFVREEEQANAQDDIELWKQVSSGRCARVSYETHDGKRDISSDVKLHDRLVSSPPHLSPLEHVASPLENPHEWSGNFQGFHQYRKDVVNDRVR